LTSEEFKDFFLQYFNELPGFDASKLDAIDWDAWFNSPVSSVAIISYALGLE